MRPVHRSSRLWLALLLAAAPATAQDTPVDASLMARAAPPADTAATSEGAAGTQNSGDKKLLGISILGNQEAPKALVLVPWKSSELGDTQGLDRGLDDTRRPVDREVFLRELAYYEIREGAP